MPKIENWKRKESRELFGTAYFWRNTETGSVAKVEKTNSIWSFKAPGVIKQSNSKVGAYQEATSWLKDNPNK